MTQRQQSEQHWTATTAKEAGEHKPVRPEHHPADGVEPSAPVTPDELGCVLTEAEPQQLVVQDYCPISESIDWELSRLYFDAHGPRAFTTGEVPYVINNDGRLSCDAAALLIAQLEVADAAGTLEDEIRVLEFGAGSGLFAKQFLDAVQRESADRGKDYYARLTYVLTDGSRPMLAEISSCGLLSDHADRLLVAHLQLPGVTSALENVFEGDVGRFRAVFANYLLDNLPCTILYDQGTALYELMVQSVIDSRVDLASHTDLTLEQIRDVLREGPDDLKRQLVELHRVMLLNARYDPVERSAIPCPDALPTSSESDSTRAPYVHSYGALECIDEILPLLAPGGFLLISDYGYDESHPAKDVHEFQHFGGSVAIGLNFSQIDEVCARRDGVEIHAPVEQWEYLLSRLIGRELDHSVVAEYKRRFDRAPREAMDATLAAARQHVEHGQYEAARWKFRHAMRLQPWNWPLIEEIAGFVLYRLKSYDRAMRLAMSGLKINPIAPGLWNILGDCLYFLDRPDEAVSAFERAVEINPDEIRGRLNLAWIGIDRGDISRALHIIADALVLDRKAEFRDALLAKQQDALTKLSADHRDEQLRHINRFRGHRNLPS